ncbi:hypothetical protein [Nitrospira lenta]|uniref:Lipoprotein n=1 Tax=Nitrospira lenta TaxID=1436998 RepID=A0A330L4J1_9BACT|nr:hypothetical protein [Nitrospira lenta]SPP64239.1 conserved exported hypothetical protein [Nitrospira lenta]
MVRSFRALFVLGVILISVACTTPQAPVVSASPAKIADTKAVLRDLWLGHILGIRNVAVATMDKNVAARESAEKSVVANAQQIAQSIEPFYGKPAADKLFSLLAGHYGAIRDDLDAVVAGNAAQQEAAVKALTANAGEISAFLSSANPYLPKDAVMGLLMAHAAHHIQQFQQLKTGEYAQEAETWTGMKKHIYVVADTLTGALAQQFPAKF